MEWRGSGAVDCGWGVVGGLSYCYRLGQFMGRFTGVEGPWAAQCLACDTACWGLVGVSIGHSVFVGWLLDFSLVDVEHLLLLLCAACGRSGSGSFCHCF